MADVTKVKAAVKESLVGTETAGDVQLSAQSKATFDKNARKDEATGELFMSEQEFINAVAPDGEDYVSQWILLHSVTRCTGNLVRIER